MNTFKRQVLDFIRQEQLIHTRDRLVIACSGGVDSMALLSFCIELQKVMEIELVVAHVDHMLRGEESLKDLQFVEEFCKEHDVVCENISIDIPKLHKEQGGNLQALCRTERYAFLRDVMQRHQANKLLTAHHADDQLESMLMALVKSASVASLKGIAPRRPFFEGEIIRPFLMVTKEEIRGYLQNKGITYREDASNSKDSYLRNRLRHKIVPILKDENLAVSAHAVQLSKQLAEDEQYLQAQALQSFQRVVERQSENLFKIKIKALQSEAVTLQRRLILILLNYLYNDTNTFQSYTLCTAILNLLQSSDGSAEVHLPKGFIARRQYESIFIGQLQDIAPIAEQELLLNGWSEFVGVRVYIGESSLVTTPQNADAYYFSKTSVHFPLCVRARRLGDKLHVSGMDQPKKLARIFIDEKIPLHMRDEWPILVDNQNKILAVLGIRVSNTFSKCKRPNDDFVLFIERLHD